MGVVYSMGSSGSRKMSAMESKQVFYALLLRSIHLACYETLRLYDLLPMEAVSELLFNMLHL